LREYKVKYMGKLKTYQAKSEREKELINMLINEYLVCLDRLKPSTLACELLASKLFAIISYESISKGFRKICHDMLIDIRKIKRISNNTVMSS